MDFDCGRMGSLQGVFIEDERKIDYLIGSETEIYFGEVLGKHSEIYGALESKDIKKVTNDPTVIDLFKKHDLSSGFNPIDYLPEFDDEPGFIDWNEVLK